MAQIRPFRALQYNQEKIADLSSVITQPYDKISPEMQDAYYARSPYNLARIIRGKQNPGDTSEGNVYTRATQDFQNWLRNQVLISETEPALYPYYQEYEIPGQPGVKKERRGFIGLCRLEDYTSRIVHRHEETLSGPKADRMELLKRTRAHFGQVFFLYSDPEGFLETLLANQATGMPWEAVEDEYGTRHLVWRVADTSTVNGVVRLMQDKKLVIADGHHRYETALAYRSAQRTEAAESSCDYIMATFIRMETEGLTILPTHRVIHSLPAFDWNKFEVEAKKVFEWEDLDPSKAVSRLQESIAQSGRLRSTLAAYAGKGRLALLRLRPDFDLDSELPDLLKPQRSLDVIILHHFILQQALGIDPRAVREEKNIHYVRELPQALGEVDSGKAQVCFLMNPTPIQSVRDVAFSGGVMPQKSTDFYPKLLSGLTIFWLDNPLGI
ncbi:MAG TPA: DUF1015 domain-containing protein [Terriglobia bacterium]|nr:DUF1015 domain-containing protein [Terriglobia bacterium]